MGDCFIRASKSEAIGLRIQDDRWFCILRCPGEDWRHALSIRARDAVPGSAIIPFLASKSLSLLFLGVPGLKRALVSGIVLIVASAAFVSCGYNGSSSQHKLSGVKFRALVSNPLLPTGTGTVSALNIVNASKDVLSASAISLSGAPHAGLMAISPNLKLIAVFSGQGQNNSIATIDTTTESAATDSSGKGTVPTFSIPGATESMFIANDNITAYAAVPSAPIVGQPSGAVVVMDLGTGTVKATIPVTGAHFVVQSPDGNHVLVFSDNSDSITVLDTILIGTSQDPRTTVSGFDRPVWAIFSDDTSAFIFNCGPECGGTAAGIATFDIGSPGPGPKLALGGATYGLLDGATLYVAGTPPNTPCGSGTAATTCGTLNLVDTSSMTITNSSPIIITDGYHDRMQMGANGRLFIGSHSCTNINVSGGEVRGCLSIFNTSNSGVVVPPQVGDATGIAPIPGRKVVYVCQGGVFQIFDTTTDQLLVQTRQTDIVGQSTDVKVVDPPPS